MQVRFERFPNDGNPDAGAGELWLIPSDPSERGRRDLAVFALDVGTSAFVAGSGTPEAIIVQADPTLDDLLAASIVGRQSAGQPLPDGLMAYARYVAAVREGLRPGTVPLETSLEGVFLACRSLNGDDLTDADNSRRFLAVWEKLAECMLKGAENGVDPFNNSLLAEHTGFVRERAFLNEDQKVYLQDVRNGERWLVKLPQGPPVAGGLLLREPKSVLWKYWARSDPQAPEGAGYLLTALDRGAGDWVISTDPIHRVPIGGLAAVLQEAEAELVGPTAAEDPWFDGKPFGYTLVAAPRARSQLPGRTIERLVRRWSGARKAPRPHTNGRPTTGYVSIAVSGCIVVLLVLILVQLYRDPAENLLPIEPRPTSDDGTFIEGESRLFVLGIGPSYRDPALNLTFPAADAEMLAQAFLEHSGGVFPDSDKDEDDKPEVYVKLIVREQATRTAVLEGLQWIERGNADETATRPESGPTRNDLVIVTISGHGVVGEDGEYFLLTHDSGFEQDPRIHGVRWDDLAYSLNQLKCTSIVILDTCHSGAPTPENEIASRGTERGASRRREDILAAATRDAQDQFRSNSKGVIILPACLGDQTAKEHPDWGHGALTLAVLEAITGTEVSPRAPLDENLPPPPHRDTSIVNFADVEHYVINRVHNLSLSVSVEAQVIDVKSSDANVLDRLIPIARRE